jgi:hypothetical protein
MRFDADPIKNFDAGHVFDRLVALAAQQKHNK